MYEARKFLLGLESNGVPSSSAPVVLNPTPNGPSPSLICPVGLDILASAGLGLSSLGNAPQRLHHVFVRPAVACVSHVSEKQICDQPKLLNQWRSFERLSLGTR